MLSSIVTEATTLEMELVGTWYLQISTKTQESMFGWNQKTDTVGMYAVIKAKNGTTQTCTHQMANNLTPSKEGEREECTRR